MFKENVQNPKDNGSASPQPLKGDQWRPTEDR